MLRQCVRLHRIFRQFVHTAWVCSTRSLILSLSLSKLSYTSNRQFENATLFESLYYWWANKNTLIHSDRAKRTILWNCVVSTPHFLVNIFSIGSVAKTYAYEVVLCSIQIGTNQCIRAQHRIVTERVNEIYMCFFTCKMVQMICLSNNLLWNGKLFRATKNHMHHSSIGLCVSYIQWNRIEWFPPKNIFQHSMTHWLCLMLLSLSH